MNFALRFVICYIGESVGEMTVEKTYDYLHFDMSIHDDSSSDDETEG